VTRLLLLRTLVVTVVLGLSVWVSIASASRQSHSATWVQSVIIAATYLSSIVFGVMLRRGVPPRRVARPMHAADLAVTSLLVYVTGGAQSPYMFLYALSIVSAGALSYRRGAAGVALASIAAATVTSVLAWLHVLAVPMSSQVTPWRQSPVELVRTLGITYAALSGVGALAFIFGDQLQRGAETLATTRKAAADLYTVHQDIVRSLSSGLLTIAADGTVLTANLAAGEILRRLSGGMVNSKIDDVMPGLPALLVGTGGDLRRADLTVPTSAGDLTIGVTVSPLRDVKDEVIGRVINFQDLTELRRLEQASRHADRLVTVGQLAAGIAHEIRNPLASISGSIELLKSGPQASEEDQALMAIVHREVQRLNVLIGDLLDYANPRPRQAIDFDLGALVEETLHVARGDQAFAAVEVTADVDKPLRLHADPAKLRQVVWNLLRNAAQAGGHHVRITARDDAGGATITVTDDGAGIPPERVARIFDPFFTTKSKGTGLGLATCHAVVVEHGGRIDVESTVGKGTKMVVRLPRES
jgi:two-component system sensor histidine kinase PilS (NtrC family)